MRLRLALRKLRNAAALSPAEERALLAHCRTVHALAVADFGRLAGQCGLRVEGLRALAQELNSQLAAPFSKPALDARNDALRADGILSTGLEPLDWLLGGGLATGEVCEMIGAPCTGKTQLCHLICAAQAALEHGATALYIDSGGAFCAERAYRLLVTRSQGMPRPACKARLGQRVRAATAPRLPEMLATLDALDDKLRTASTEADGQDAANGDDDDARWCRSLRLLVVDSAHSVLGAEHGTDGGDHTATAVASRLRLQHRLRELAIRHRLAVLVTNAVSSSATVASMAPDGKAWCAPAFAHVRVVLSRQNATPSAAEVAALAVLAQVVRSPSAAVRPVHKALAVGGHGGAARIAFSSDGAIEAERGRPRVSQVHVV